MVPRRGSHDPPRRAGAWPPKDATRQPPHGRQSDRPIEPLHTVLRHLQPFHSPTVGHAGLRAESRHTGTRAKPDMRHEMSASRASGLGAALGQVERAIISRLSVSRRATGRLRAAFDGECLEGTALQPTLGRLAKGFDEPE
jgi:hypothetical protein